MKEFWNKEYKTGEHLTLSKEPSSDLITFARWAQRNAEWDPFPKGGVVLDLGCGNGRNIINLCEAFQMKGFGIDISETAIEQAKEELKRKSKENLKKPLSIEFKAQSLTESIDVSPGSVDVVLDMMTSHFLNSSQRERLLKEILKMLKPYGWLFFKTFILDDDAHAKRLISEHPGKEPNSYIHPQIKTEEYVWTISKIHEFFGPHFKIHKAIRSYKHRVNGQPFKRRTVSVYMEKKGQ